MTPRSPKLPDEIERERRGGMIAAAVCVGAALLCLAGLALAVWVAFRN